MARSEMRKLLCVGAKRGKIDRAVVRYISQQPVDSSVSY